MLSWIVQTTILSIIFIFLIHHLIHFFKNNLTVPKIKDLVNSPQQKYDSIYQVISKKSSESTNDILQNKYSYSESELIPQYDNSSMKNELKNFLKNQMKEMKNIEPSSHSSTEMYSTY